MTEQEQQALDAITALMQAGQGEAAAMVLRGFAVVAAPASAPSKATGNAERCRRYRDRKAGEHVETMSRDMSNDTQTDMLPHVETMSNHVNSTYVVKSTEPSGLIQGDVLNTPGTALSLMPSMGNAPARVTRSVVTALPELATKMAGMSTARGRTDRDQRATAELVFRYWQVKLGHERAMFSRDREAKILARLREGATADELCYAIDGIAKSAFHRGENDSGQRYDGIELLFRNRGNVERFASSRNGYQRSEPHPFVADAKRELQDVAVAGLLAPPSHDQGVAHG
jgi:hypothetical protein